MTKNNPSPGRRNKVSPLIIIGGSVLILAVAFYFISRVMIDQRDPEVSRVLAEQSAERHTEDAGGNDNARSLEMREDATLSFLAPDGSVRTTVGIEIAEDEVSRTQGLMGRQHIGENQGMLFIFPDEDFRSFWMANTPLPLDIIFVNRGKKIVTIQRNTVPYSEESVPSTAPATYVVEVNAGFADRHGVAEGDMVQWIRK